jgi:hypothetical protein
MKNYILLLALLLLGAGPARAQRPEDAARRDSAIKVVVTHHGRYSSFLYTINDEPLTAATLKSVLQSYPPAAAELRRGRSQQRLAYALLPVFIAGIIVGGVQSDKHKEDGGSPFSRAPVPFSIGLGAFFGSIVFAVKSDHFMQAIEIYNSRFHRQDTGKQ